MKRMTLILFLALFGTISAKKIFKRNPFVYGSDYGAYYLAEDIPEYDSDFLKLMMPSVAKVKQLTWNHEFFNREYEDKSDEAVFRRLILVCCELNCCSVNEVKFNPDGSVEFPI